MSDTKPQQPKPLVQMAPGFTVVEMSEEDRREAVQDAILRTLSPHEWTWAPDRTARMAQYVLWASQRLEIVGGLAKGGPLGRADAS